MGSSYYILLAINLYRWNEKVDPIDDTIKISTPIGWWSTRAVIDHAVIIWQYVFVHRCNLAVDIELIVGSILNADDWRGTLFFMWQCNGEYVHVVALIILLSSRKTGAQEAEVNMDEVIHHIVRSRIPDPGDVEK